jgi:hypothetical protein
MSAMRCKGELTQVTPPVGSGPKLCAVPQTDWRLRFAPMLPATRSSVGPAAVSGYRLAAARSAPKLGSASSRRAALSACCLNPFAEFQNSASRTARFKPYSPTIRTNST